MDRIGTDIQYAARLLRDGKLVAIPTETVYGLAANALDPGAVLRVFEVKERPSFDPLIVHVGSKEQALGLISDPPEEALDLMNEFWPGPLTLVLAKRDLVPDLVTSGLPTIAVRMPAHPMALSLLRSLPFPLAAPSANPFGYISPTSAQHVIDGLGDKVAYVLDGGSCRIGVESTVLGYLDGAWVLLRQGGVAQESIEEHVQIGAVQASSTSRPEAPGMLSSHYAPRTPLVLGDPKALLPNYAGARVAVLSFQERYSGGMVDLVLSPSGELTEAARNLFALLRQADASGAEVIIAERVPQVGLGRAINDRLARAATERDV